MAIAILVGFAVLFVFVRAFKSETTVTRHDESGNLVTEQHTTVHHSAGQTAARVIVGMIIFIVLVLVLLILAHV